MSDIALRVDSLEKTFRSRTFYRRREPPVLAVDGLSFAVRRGQIFGLLGPNGAGKTTTLRILTTLIRPSAGSAEVDGFDVIERPLEVRRRISTVVQETAVELFLTVRDNLLTYARFHGIAAAAARRRAAEVMERLEIAGESDRKVQDLSGGYRRRVQVAKIFMVDTPVVFLDEFSTGMDPILKRSVMQRLRDEAARGRTVVLTTQVLGEAEELCDDILIIDRGRQVARGDLHSLKLLCEPVYEVALTFERLPPGLEHDVARLQPVRVGFDHNTVELALKADEAKVLENVAALARRGTVLRVEVTSASLEDVFVQLTAGRRG